ncbi:hypothetical protein HWQ67_14400, partial [Candidatus Magnetobacterium casensis]|nr:hypothetical protein [Candidatus Magnetobacterium casensis]
FMRKEVFDLFLKELGLWKDGVSNRLTAIETRLVVWGAAMSVGLLVVTIILRFVKI